MERTWISESDTPGIWIPALPFRRCVCNTHYFTRNGNPVQYSCLKNPIDREAWWATVYGVTKSWTWLSDFHFTLSHRTDLKQFSSAAQSCLTLCDPMDRSTPGLPVPSPTPGVHPNSRPLSWWCHPTISSSVIPSSCRPQSFPASGSFQINQLFTSGGQSTGVSASTSVLQKQHLKTVVRIWDNYSSKSLNESIAQSRH